MLDSEPNSHETENNNEAAGHEAGGAPAPTVFNGPAEPPVTSGGAVPTVPAALFQPPQVLFQPPAPVAPPPAAERDAGARDSGAGESGGKGETEADAGRTSRRTRGRGRSTRARDAAPDDDVLSTESAGAVAEADEPDSEA